MKNFLGSRVVGQDIPAIVVRFISRSRERATYRAGCSPLRKNRIHSRSQKQNTRPGTRSGNFWNQGHNKCRLQGLQNTFSYSFGLNRSSKIVRATRSPCFTRSVYLGKIVRSGRSVVRVVRPESFGRVELSTLTRPSLPGFGGATLRPRRAPRPAVCLSLQASNPPRITTGKI